MAAHRMADHRVDADKAGAAGDFHRALHRAGAAEDVGETAFPAGRHGDLVHRAARSADHMVLGELGKLGDACRIQTQIQVGIEATDRAHFRGGRGADADIHRHAAQQQHAEAIGQADAFLAQHREDRTADVGRPGGERVALAELADFAVFGRLVVQREKIERNACFHRQVALSDLHRADAQRAVGAGLQGDQVATAQNGFTDVRSGIIGDAAHHVEPGGHPGHPDLPGIEKSRQTGGVVVGTVEKAFELGEFRSQLVVIAHGAFKSAGTSPDVKVRGAQVTGFCRRWRWLGFPRTRRHPAWRRGGRFRACRGAR